MIASAPVTYFDRQGAWPASAARFVRKPEHAAEDSGWPLVPTAISVRSFGNFPDLALWCRARLPRARRRHFAMGFGEAFVTLLDFMHEQPAGDIELLAISTAERPARQGGTLLCALARRRHDDGSGCEPDEPAEEAVLLYLHSSG